MEVSDAKIISSEALFLRQFVVRKVTFIRNRNQNTTLRKLEREQREREGERERERDRERKTRSSVAERETSQIASIRCGFSRSEPPPSPPQHYLGC
jgi:hypothetical protein